MIYQRSFIGGGRMGASPMPRPARREVRAAWNAARERGAHIHETLALCMLAELEAASGAVDEALALVAQGLDIAAHQERPLSLTRLHCIRGDILSASDPAAAEEAYRELIRIAHEQGGRTFELLAALPLAKLLQANNRLVEAYDVLAPALEGFAPTPELPQIAEAQASLAALEETDAVRAERRNRGIRAKYAHAVMITKGYTAPATQAAFDRVDGTTPLQSGEPGRWAALYAQGPRHHTAGELHAALAVGELQLREAEAANLPMRAAVAHRFIGLVKYNLGSFADARDHAERALAMYDEGWAESALAATGGDFLSVTYAYLANPLWALGDIQTAEDLMRRAVRRAEGAGQPYGLAWVLNSVTALLLNADRPGDLLRIADALSEVTAAHAIGAYELQAKLCRGWANGRLTDAKAGAHEVRAALSVTRERGEHIRAPRALALLADLEAASGAVDEALASVAQGLEIAAQQGHRALLPPLHRLRGDILAARDPAAAEEAYRESIRIAHEQGARTFVLLAALPLAKLLQANNRPAEAYDAVVPALEGFAPTPELPQIAEAQALMATLAARDLPKMQQE